MSDSFCFYTDAAESKGYGLLFGKQWAYGKWPESWTDLHFILAFFPIVLKLSIGCKELRDKRVMFITDNESIVYVINQ